MIKTSFIIFAMVMALLEGCLLGQVEKPINQVEIHRVKNNFLDNFDSLEAHPFDEQLSQAAAEAQLALVKRLTGEYADTECGDMFRQNAETLYVMADTTFTLPAGPPQLVRVQTSEELDSTAAKEGMDLLVVSMVTLGSKNVQGKRGIMVGFEYFAIDWERARWNALSPYEQSQLDMPAFRQIQFGGWCKYLVVRNGDRLVFYDEPITFS